MLCRNPYTQGIHAHPCGQCMPCRLNRRRVWTHRLLLEQLQHGDSSFVTFTYNDESLPADGSLDPKHMQDWLKRFRKAIQPVKVRYFLVGEYGDVTERPHYHAAIFGYPPCHYLRSRYSSRRSSCCLICDQLRDTWGKGHILSGTLEEHSAQYVAGYVTKKLTAKDDARLKGRHPEFARMSLRPGIGADAIHEIASVFLLLNLEDTQADVPSALRHGSRLWPLGQFLRRKLREATFGQASTPEAAKRIIEESLRPLFDASRSFVEASPEVKRLVYKDLLTRVDEQKVVNRSTRDRLYKRRRDL